MRPARSRTVRSGLAVGAAVVLVLTTGCAARFARTDAAGQSGLTTDEGSGNDQSGTVPDGQVAPGATDSAPAVIGGQPVAGGTGGQTLTGRGAAGGSHGTTARIVGPTAGPGSIPAGSTSGVSSTAVKIGYFIPQTGAAPMPPTIAAQSQSYWDYVNAKGGIYGRKVTVKIYDTGSTEAGARSAVQQAQSDGILAAASLDALVVEAALAKALHAAGIPQLVTQMSGSQAIPADAFYIGTNQVNNAKQIADYMAHTLKLTRVGVVDDDSTTLAARDAFVARAKADGLQVVHNEVVNGKDSQFLAEAQKLASDKPQAVWLYASPNTAINLAVETRNDGFHPTWVSSSFAWGFNLVLSGAAGALDGAKTFSTWGGLTDPRYKTYNQVNTHGRSNDDKDIGLPAWGWGQLIAAAMKAAGRDLGRNSFRVAMQNLTTGTTDGVTGAPMCWPPTDFTGNKRYGSGDRTIVMGVQGSGASAIWATESDYRSVY